VTGAGPLRPMLASMAAAPFHRAAWVYEQKYDGWRLLAHRKGRTVSLLTRNLKDLTPELPEIAAALAALPGGDFVLDGELVVFDRHGVSRFQLLQRRGETGIHPTLVLFDCLEREGRSLLRKPLRERRRELEQILAGVKTGPLTLAKHAGSNGLAAFEKAKKSGWEGILAKDESSPYEPGRRSLRWLKVKVRKESEFVIGGFTLPSEKRVHFGALLVGLCDGKKLRYAGRVGTGFSEEVLHGLLTALQPLVIETCPFDPDPKERGAVWVKPRLVAQVAYTEWTADEKLRQPSFLGLRNDKKPSDRTWSEREL
jgi:DNA ligase D-like protein (predicted ligase)